MEALKYIILSVLARVELLLSFNLLGLSYYWFNDEHFHSTHLHTPIFPLSFYFCELLYLCLKECNLLGSQGIGPHPDIGQSCIGLFMPSAFTLCYTKGHA